MQKAEASKPFGLSVADLRRPDHAHVRRRFSPGNESICHPVDDERSASSPAPRPGSWKGSVSERTSAGRKTKMNKKEKRWDREDGEFWPRLSFIKTHVVFHKLRKARLSQLRSPSSLLPPPHSRPGTQPKVQE